MASTIKLPPRKGAINYTEDHIQDIYETLMGDDVNPGEAVIVDEVQDTETKAGDRAKKVKDLLGRAPHDLKVKAHSVETEDGFIPAVSIPIGAQK